MSDPLVSIILSAYNAEKFLRQALDSACGQTYGNIEIIAVNDGSTDGTGEILQEYSQRESRIKVIHQKNSGLSVSRNRAIENSRGEFVAPMDADDIWYPLKIQRQIEKMLELDESYGLVYTWGFLIDESDALLGVFGERVEGDVFFDMIYSNVAPFPLYRRRCLDVVGGYDPALKKGCEDWDLHIRISRLFRVGCVPDRLVAYRRSPDSMSADVRSMRDASRDVLRKIRCAYPEMPSTLIRLSESRVDFTFSAKLFQQKQHARALGLLLSSIFRDPLWILWPFSLPAYLHRHAGAVSLFLKSHGFRLRREVDERTIFEHHQQDLSSPDLFSRMKQKRLRRLKARYLLRPLSR